MIIIPTGMDNNVSKALSLYLIMAISPMMKPITPSNARTGVGRGSLIVAPIAVILMAISTMNAIVKLAAHFPVVVLDQNCIFMIVSSIFLFKVNCRCLLSLTIELPVNFCGHNHPISFYDPQAFLLVIAFYFF